MPSKWGLPFFIYLVCFANVLDMSGPLHSRRGLIRCFHLLGRYKHWWLILKYTAMLRSICWTYLFLLQPPLGPWSF